MAKESDHFELQKLHDLFYACHAEDGTICVDNYTNAYDEISKLFKLLGAVFNFVSSDVVEKVEILREYRKSDLKDEYDTIQHMIKYEVDNKLTKNKKKASGSRTLLRLHRALHFVVDFMRNIKEADEGAKLCGLCSESYYRTLSKHHPWLIRKGVDMAVYMLPSRKHFMEKMKIADLKQAEKLLEAVAVLGEKIFEIVEKEYADNKLLDLP